MFWKKSLLQLLNRSVILPLGMLMIPNFDHQTLANPLPFNHNANSWQIAQSFTSPNPVEPESSSGGGTRGRSCTTNGKEIIPLIPKTEFEYTTSENTTFFFYVPEPLTKEIKFSLLDEKAQTSVLDPEIIVKSPEQSGIVSVKLPADTAKSLQVGKTYKWFFEVVCDANDPSGSIAVQGEIQRKDLDLTNDLKNTPKSSIPQLYADRHIWYETIASAAELKCKNPNDNTVQTNWKTLLTSVGLDASIADKPLLDCPASN